MVAPKTVVAALLVSLASLVWVVGNSAARAAEPSALVLVDMDGTQHHVDALLDSGQNVALVFWQTWCTSCKREAPNLAQAIREHADAIRFFGVVSGPDAAVDDEKVRRVAREWKHPHPQIRDRDLSLTRRFNVRGTPVIIVLGRDGEVLYRGYRPPKSWAALRGAGAGDAAPPASGAGLPSDPSVM